VNRIEHSPPNYYTLLNIGQDQPTYATDRETSSSVSFTDQNEIQDGEHFVFTSDKQRSYYIESPEKDGVYFVRSTTDNDSSGILTDHVKIYTGPDRTQAWTANGNRPVSCVWYWPIVYSDTEIFVFAVQISIKDEGAPGQTWKFVPVLKG
jgi:hypothetical protein